MCSTRLCAVARVWCRPCWPLPLPLAHTPLPITRATVVPLRSYVAAERYAFENRDTIDADYLEDNFLR